QRFILIADFLRSAKNFREIDAADADPEGLQKFFTIAGGVEGVWSGAHGTQPGLLHSVDHPANSDKFVEIGLKGVALRENGMSFGDTERDSILIKIVADRDFPAKGVTPAL